MKNIIFDLDGTLIDSSNGILSSLAIAFKKNNIEPQQQLTSDVIGPPLMQVLSTLAATDNKDILEKLAASFKKTYDEKGYKLTAVFDGVTDMLKILQESESVLYIATNKRFNPTSKIVKYLDWNRYFKEVCAIDSFPGEVSNKATLLEFMIDRNKLTKDSVVYVGDRDEDRDAADHNDIPFLRADWGYGVEVTSEQLIVNSPYELCEYINSERHRQPVS